MNSPRPPYAYKSPAIYNPRLWQANEVRAYYVARPGLLNRIVDDLKREAPASRPQHRLIVGLRGMGKSTLLRRLAVAIEDDVELDAHWLPLSFPEEQYNVARLSDFWLNCLDALSDLLESRGRVAESRSLDDEVERLDRKDGEGALNALLRCSARLERRLVLLVDNIDLVFERLRDDEWKLREALQAHPELLVIGASAQALEASYDYRAAFYDFFKVDELRGLSEAEMRETIVNLARLNKAEHIVRRLDADPARLKVLHTLTGGNPRTAVLLYGVLLKGIDGDVRSDLEGLLDEVTPLYKARFEELPPQSQQLLDKLALHWHPANAAILAEQLGWKVNLVSAQLDRLINAGIVERVKAPKSKRLHFQIGERFFNIWYLMRTSRRLRRRLIWLVECLRGLYSAEELHAIARQKLEKNCASIREAETLVALSEATEHQALKRALIDHVLEMLIDTNGNGVLHELFDLEGDDKEIGERSKRMAAAVTVRKAIEKAFTGRKRAEIRKKVDASLFTPGAVNRLMKLLDAQPPERLEESLNGFLERESATATAMFGPKATQLLAKAMDHGAMSGVMDVEGGEAQAIRLDQPYLAALPRLFRIGGEMTKQAGEIERLCRLLLSFDDSGYFPWMLLEAALLEQDQPAEAALAGKRLLMSENAPFKHASVGLFLLIMLHDRDWPTLAAPLLARLSVDDPEDFERLFQIGQIAVASNEATTLLTLLDAPGQDSEFMPFREALSAATHNDASLLDLLAPEVRGPAREILAFIAPKLLANPAD